MDSQAIERAKEHFGRMLDQQLARVERIKTQQEWTDYSKVKPIIVGVIGGDGIGPYIAAEARRVLETILSEEVAAG
ncbi:MAG: isocitrate/isopropylmalate dehydrogenase family protein, partial [Candidatus Eisenbacteria bacterium]|nr:isocitrate/isopropylmalate dehydrogenase family protein [Candidatus Eisenbacteria bacterium]